MKTSLLFSIAAASSAYATELIARQETASNWTVGQTVQTSSGAVSGHAASNQTAVSEYLGIPFALPPIGDLRFEAPVKFTGNSPLAGSKFGPSCPVAASTRTLNAQSLANANVTLSGLEYFTKFGVPNSTYDEDCLYLNVWTKPQSGDSKKAVLVWIYGGAFTSGSSANSGYNGANLAEQEDVIVVSLNYRLSILGFSGNPNGTQNVALMDQRMAVEWVRDNVEKFGGDKSRITIFGQSAGGVSVDLYSYAYNSDPIAAGFIPESGTVFSWGLPNSKTVAAKGWFGTAQNLGCGNSSTDAATLVSCMRSKNSTALLAAIPPTSGTAGILGLFGPTVDDTIVFSNYTERTPAKVPVLVGNTDYEAGLFRVQFGLANLTLPDRFWNAFNLQEFTCPAGIRANASVAADVPTWRYRYMGVWDNTALSPQSGAYHTAEIPILFDTAPTVVPATEEYIAVGNYMRGAWAAFAKDPVKGLTTYGWPSYSTSSDSLIRLAFDNSTGTNAVNPSLYDANCRFANVSSTDVAGFLNIPEDTTPSQTPSSGPSPTGSAAPSATKNAGTRSSASLSAMLMGAAMLYLL